MKRRSRVRRWAGWLLWLALPLAAPSASEFPVDGFAATVNDRVITVGDVIASMQEDARQLQLRYTGTELRDRLDEAFRAALDRQIERALVLEEFKRREESLRERNLAITDTMVEDEINRTIARRFANNRSQFLDALKEEQLTLREYRDRIREMLQIYLLREIEIQAHVIVTPGMARAAYDAAPEAWTVPEKARLTQLALDLPENDPAVTAARLARLEELAGQWRNGAEFTSLLTPAPDGLDPAFSGPQPPVPLGDLHPDLARAVAALAPGEISAPVTLPGIAFVVRLDERLPGGRKPFDDVRGEIELNLRRAEGEKISRAFVEKLRQKHFVRIIRDRLGRPTEP